MTMIASHKARMAAIVEESLRLYGENQSCTLVSTAFLARKSYSEVREVLKAKCPELKLDIGYASLRVEFSAPARLAVGQTMSYFLPELESIITKMMDPPVVDISSLKRFDNIPLVGEYLMWVRNSWSAHVCPVIDGYVYNGVYQDVPMQVTVGEIQKRWGQGYGLYLLTHHPRKEE